MTLKDTLHTISEKSDATHSNLWYAIEDELQEQNLMKKKKRQSRQFSLRLSLVAALIGLLVIGGIAFGMMRQQPYYTVTLDDIQALANPINASVTKDDLTLTIDWAYADSSQLVYAYTLADGDGNPIPLETLPDGTVELTLLWNYEDDRLGTYQPTMGFSRYGIQPNGENTGQQIIQHYSLGTRFELLANSTLGDVNLDERPYLDLRLALATGSGADLYTTILVEFQVPYRATQFAQYNEIVPIEDLYSFIPPTVDEFAVHFNSLVLSDSATTVEVCVQFPDDSLSGFYKFGEITLSVDGRAVTLPDYEERSAIYRTFGETAVSFGVTAGEQLIQCSDLTWNIVFHELPKTIGIEIAGLVPDAQSIYFPERDHLDAFVAYQASNRIEITDIDYERLSIVYPDFESPYADTVWSYTFDLSD
ncbi:MAG: DUF4179 domain-containing protein [Chloroflexota bacterium]